MKKMMKLYSLVTVLLVFSLMAAACSGKSTGTAEQNGSASNNSPAEKTTITYWSLWNQGEPQQVVMQNIIDEYEAAHPNVKIDVQWMGRQVLSKVQNALLSKDAPDIVDHLYSTMKTPILEGGLTESLNDLLKEEIPNENVPLESVFTEGLIDMITLDGNVSFIPYEVISGGFFYDDNMFNALGIEPPATWEEFIAMGETMKSEGIPPLSLDGTASGYTASYYYWLATRLGGPDALAKVAGDETGAAWDDPIYLEAAQKTQELVDRGFFMEGYSGSQYPAAQTSWAQGKAGLNLNGTWLPSETATYASDGFKYRAFAFPEIVGAQGDYNDVEVDTMGWVALKGAKMDVVGDFLLFAMQKKYQEKIATDATNLTARHDIPAPEVLADFDEIIKNAKSFHMKYAGMTADYPEWWSTVFLPLDNKLVFGELTAEAFISEIKKETVKFWKQQ